VERSKPVLQGKLMLSHEYSLGLRLLALLNIKASTYFGKVNKSFKFEITKVGFFLIFK